jgi:hypothetical protein
VTWQEIINEYEEGLLTQRASLRRLAELAASGDVEQTLRCLPLEWRKDVELYIFKMYDNDIDSDDFIEIGIAEPDLALRRTTIAALRAWIARKKVTNSLPQERSEP